jgi:hypothetical protein
MNVHRKIFFVTRLAISPIMVNRQKPLILRRNDWPKQNFALLAHSATSFWAATVVEASFEIRHATFLRYYCTSTI